MKPSLRSGMVAAALIIAVTASSCATRGAEAGGESGDVKTDFGVTADTITIGAMSDLSNVFAGLGRTLVDGNRLYFNERNADGGICGRQVELEVADHAYDVQKATSQFVDLEKDVLGFVQLLGSPVIAALSPQIATTGAITIPATWSTDWIGKEGLVVVGASYPGEIINGLDHLMREGLIAEGDTIGHVYFEGDFGGNALLGSQYVAKEAGLELEAIAVDPTATDLTAQVNQLANAEVDAILVSAGPRQTASIAGVAAASGLDVPILTNGPGFDPALLDTPVGGALKDNLRVITSYEPFAGDSVTAQQVAEAYEGDDPTIYVNYGYASAAVMGQALDQACENGDLTRAGVASALRSLDAVDTGLMPVMDLTDGSVMPTNETFVSVVDPDQAGGLTVVEEPFASELAEEFAAQ
ncbi:ABC transporter substrate-binding protein [Nocardioides limicola]|uniref:ABC transporter substrate-binding protein n=1 Tax=Nocardioides limicola TaxID=2803368 RepID=UPI00193BF175|nr:ABC transporter substrate-binding protein [Nocardioides sp. DJM-14]